MSFVRALEPEIDRLTKIMSTSPYVGTELWKSSHGWSVTLKECWDLTDGEAWLDSIRFSSEFDRAVEWTVAEAGKWSCKRVSYDTWAFKSRREAEKFITYFSLKWA